MRSTEQSAPCIPFLPVALRVAFGKVESAEVLFYKGLRDKDILNI